MSERTRAQTVSATFPPHPRSVRMARSFIRAELGKAGGGARTDTAALAATELVTNVVLHARTDFMVSVSPLGAGRVRVAVSDGSTVLPVPQILGTSSALGRGLRLVERLSDAWGAELLDAADDGGPGKTVWFEVGSDRRHAARVSTSYQPPPDPLTAPRVPLESLVDVRLVGTPLQLFARESARHRELMREMALVAFSDEAPTHHVPAALTRLAAELEEYRGVGAATDAVRDDATARGVTSMNLDYRLPRAVGPACRRLNALLDDADEYCRSDNLLTLAATPQGRALRRWYLGEIANQIDGAAPTQWTGPLE